MEKIIVANLKMAIAKPRTKRRRVAVETLRMIVARHAKVDVSTVKLDGELIDQLFQNGGTDPLRRIRVKVVSDEKGMVMALPPEKKVEKPKEKSEMKKAEPKKSEAKETKPAAEKKEAEKKEQPKPKFEQKTVEGAK